MSGTGVASGRGEGDELAAAITRLEAAMERIAVAARPAVPAPKDLAGRLDGMIARVKSALDET